MNILIIDDTQADQDMCIEYLGGEGHPYHFFRATTSAQGLELFAHHDIDCVLLDYHLPDMDGLEVLKRLSAHGKPIPIIMMTGEGSEIIAVTAMKLGSQDYIPKKVITASALKRAVERATDRIEILKQVEKYRADLERSNRDLEQFATIVAHDLKSPLRAVTQHLSLIKHKISDQLDEKSLRSLEFAVDGAERMRLLIDSLFTYAKLGFCEPVFEEVDMETIVETVKNDLATVIDEHAAQITSDALPCIHGDPVLLTQLLQNLICNAIKYCKETPRIHVSAEPQGDGWRIGVRDNGIGIAPSQYEKIFAIFRRLHQEEDYPGIGLGLAICQRIVKQHGGIISVESEPGKGSLFYFTLPAIAVVSERKQVAYG